MKTKCIIIEDEPIAIDVIESHLSYFHDFEIVAKCYNAVEALEFINKLQIDLIFLDIHLPQISGIEFLNTINKKIPVIITTAYREYALDGYQFDVIDYLLKPVTFSRFLKAINKYYDQRINERVYFKNEKGLPLNQFIYLKEKKETYKIFIEDILYVESNNGNLNIFLKKRNYLLN